MVDGETVEEDDASVRQPAHREDRHRDGERLQQVQLLLGGALSLLATRRRHHAPRANLPANAQSKFHKLSSSSASVWPKVKWPKVQL